eukprot:CAMPEP_0183348288 /NCGR_PEP_ID=MMETSP0164_2-20130417/12840_1 /TAXON_ID=221442 /ORGANISM="Coccolithus pelagicus ssp braarudi, Strain PLY182g" /LENGTH=96 /DNA_ID=CAMNT_0025519851 /DNA_START=236 /DNA_END=522 /DNA_ORIENTATION=+
MQRPMGVQFEHQPSVFLGLYYTHHGHFLVETLARLWIFTSDAPAHGFDPAHAQPVFLAMGKPGMRSAPSEEALQRHAAAAELGRIFFMAPIRFIRA